MLALLAASSLAFIYVGSLYIWKRDGDNDHRDSPHTIRRRFLSAFCTVCISPLVVKAFGSPELLAQWPLATILGARTAGLASALFWPLLLTVVLFSGPLVVMFSSDNSLLRLRSKLYNWQYYLTNLIFWRNYIVAPFTEEFTFRACMLPILLGRYSTKNVVLFSPMLFGIAHFHHMIERVRSGQSLQSAFLISSFQFTYTTIFGVYSAHLYVQTGHLAACVVVHAFCNFMGFPDFGEVLHQPQTSRRLAYSAVYVMGLVAFCFLLTPLTDPTIYANQVFRW